MTTILPAFLLSGYEVSVLALLAQARRLSSQDKARILSKLDGSALKIAQIVIGQTIQASEDEHAAAQGFLSWGSGGRSP